jgi:chromosome partitioning protein
VALAGRGKRVLLIDCDAQAHATRCVLPDEARPERTISDLLDDPPSRAHRAVSETPYQNLWLVAADDTLTSTTQGLSTRVRREERLCRAVDALEAHEAFNALDHILIDSAPTESTLTHNVIRAAELLLIPVQTGGGAIEGVEPLLELAAEIHDSDEVPYRLLLTMFDSRTTVTNSEVIGRLRQYKRQVMRIVIPRSEPINQANLTSKPISAHAPGSRGAQAYEALAREVQRIQV